MGSFIKHWDDDVMLSLCKLVEIEEGHLKSGDNMTIKWERITARHFNSFPDLKKCEWLNLKKNFETTAKNLQLYACENQHSNLSAEGLEPSQWITKMLALTMAAENIKNAKKSKNDKIAKNKRSMERIETGILEQFEDVHQAESPNENSNGEDMGDDISETSNNEYTSKSARNPSKKSKSTSSVRSASPMTLYDISANRETDKLLAQVKTTTL